LLFRSLTRSRTRNNPETLRGFCLAAWLAGTVFTLLKGIDRNPWGVGIFDLDLVVLLTGYLFLSFSSVRAAIFAIGQGLLIDIFSSGPTGLSPLIYFGVFWSIYLGSLFFNFETAKGQVIIVSSAVMMKWAMWQIAHFFLSQHMALTPSLICTAAVAIIGTGLITPWLYAAFDDMRRPSGKEDAPALEEISEPQWINDRYRW